MKNLQNRFDHKKVILDKEKLWDRIEKPKKNRRRGFFYWMAGLGVLILAGWFYFESSFQAAAPQLTQDQILFPNQVLADPTQDQETSLLPSSYESLNANDTFSLEKNTQSTNHHSDIPPNTLPAAELLQAISKKPKTNHSVLQKNVINYPKERIPLSSSSPTPSIQHTEEKNPIASKPLKQSKSQYAQLSSASSFTLFPPIPLVIVPLNNPPLTLSFDPLSITANSLRKSNIKRNRLSITLGTGCHQNFFQNRQAGSIAEIRSMLEKESRDYQVGLQYERTLFKNFYVFAGGTYTRFEDQLQSNISAPSYQLNNTHLEYHLTTTRYRLYNQYQFIDLIIGVGKEISWAQWSIDLSAGLGLSIAQWSDGDYFDESIELAALSISGFYTNQRTTFQVFDLGIRRSLFKDYAIKGGIQFQTKRRFSDKSVDFEHKARPTFFYLQMSKAF